MKTSILLRPRSALGALLFASLALHSGAVRSVLAQAPLSNLGPSRVTVSGRQLLVQKRNLDGTLADAAPYFIRSVCWSPAGRTTATSPGDANNVTVRRTEFGNWYLTDIPLLKAMNVNTVRTFMDFGTDATLGSVGQAVLDEFYRQGIMVILTVDDSNNDTNRIARAVPFYRSHPAILLWSLGSEWNINRYFRGAEIPTPLEAAQRTELAAQLVKSLDVVHPVVSSYGDLDGNIALFAGSICPSVDIWSFNVYRGASFGALFSEWASISPKPMFLGEFGVDAFHAINPRSSSPSGRTDEDEQAQYDLALWDEIHGNRSASNPANVCLGGAVFAWNDEWWKVAPWFSQETAGWLAPGFPDGHASEDIFGIVDIDRHPRRAYDTLRMAFAPDYIPTPMRYTYFRVASAGGPYGAAEFFRGVLKFFARGGGGGGGRGFNVAAINPATGQLLEPVQTFDTWADRNSGAAHAALSAFLDRQTNGTLLLLAVGDEAGLNEFPPLDCTFLSYPFVSNLMQKLEALGSTRIRQYCYRSAWAMLAYKGDGGARAEAVATNQVNLSLHIDGTLSITSLPDQGVAPGTSTPVLNLEVDDSTTPASNLVVTAMSSDLTTVPLTGIALGGAGVRRTIRVTPSPQAAGASTITLTVRDGHGHSANMSFAVIVRPRLLNPRFAGFQFRADVQTIPGRRYALEFMSGLDSDFWVALPTVIGDGSVMVLLDSTPVREQRFYRARVD